MANRQNRFLLKRSNVPNNVPSPGQILLGELALNTADVVLYTSGTTQNQILPIGWDRIHRTGDTVTGDFIFNGDLTVTGNTNVFDLSVTNNVNVLGTINSQFVTADFITSLSGFVNNFVVDNLEIDNSLNIFAPTISNSSINALSFNGNIFSGGTFYGDGSNLSGITDIFVTGGTYNNNTGIATFNNNTGGTFQVSGFFTGSTEVFVTGGTINISGDTIFTNNTGGTFTVLGSNQYGAGVLQGSSGWTQAFNGTITLPTVVAAIYDNENFITPLKTYTITGGTSGTEFPSLVDNDTNYIFIDYNSGNPIYNISTTDTTNGSNRVRVLTVYRLNNFLHVLDFGNQGSGTSNRIINRIISTERFARENGLSLGVSGTTGIVTLTSGAAWNGINRQELDAVNSQNDIFFQNYHIGGIWTATTTADTFNNIYYDDGTDKVSATTGSYLVNWYYRGQEINDHLYEVWGDNEYATIDDAEASGEPPLPELVSSHAFLVGRLIIEAGSFSAVTVQSSFTQQFQSSQVTVHNNLSGLQGGSAGEYYHLTQSQYNNNAYTNVDNNFSVGQTFNSDISGGTVYFSGTSNLKTVTAETISNVDYIEFNTLYTPTVQEGRIHWDADYGTIDVDLEGSNVSLKVGLDNLYYIKNQSGATIDKGRVVRAAGTLGSSGRILGEYMVADGSIPYFFTLGISAENILDGEDGYVYEFGLLKGVDTTGSDYGEVWGDGTILYVHPTIPGGLTNVEPVEPNLKIQMAIVIDSDSNGSIFIRPSLRSNLGDLHNIQTSGATNGDLIAFDSSDNVWKYSKNLNGNYTINGDLNITGNTNTNILTANTITTSNITGVTYNIQSPVQDDTLDDFLVIDNDGNFFTRNFNSVNYIPNVVTVSLSGGSADFTSIKSAVDSITAATSTNPWLVKVGPGRYNEDPITTKPFVAIVGDSSVTTIVNANNPNQSLFLASDNSFISDLLIQGCTGTNVAAVLYSSSTVTASNAIVYIENVRFGANYTHVRNNPHSGGNTAIQCTNIKYGAQPFTLGFYMTSDGASIGRFQLRNVTTTAGGVANTTGLTFAKVDQPNCSIIGNSIGLTKAGSAPVSGVGFHVENGGLLRLNGFNIQRFGTGIYAPQVGSAPTIDAIGLNFENCTTDVDIVHSGATGKVNGTDSFLKTKINIDAPLYEVNKDPRELIVAKKGGDFSSIKSAVDYLISSGNTSSSNRFVITVNPGEFTEDEIDLTNTPYVSIVGSNIQTTLIKPSSPNQHIIKIGATNEISFLTLSGAGVGYSAIYCDDIGNFGQAHKVSFFDSDTNVWVKSSTQDTIFYGEYLDFNGEYSYGVKVEADNGFQAYANIENYYQFPSSTASTIGNYCSGSGGTINIAAATMEGVGASGSTAFHILDSANLNLASVDINNWDYGVRNPNIGLGVTFEVVASIWSDCVSDISIENVNTTGTFQGIASHIKTTTASENVYWLFLDPDDGELDITRKGSVTFSDGTHTDFTTLLFESGTMGLLQGGEITSVSGLTINTAEGYGYLESPTTPGIVKRIDWNDSQITLPSGSTRYIFINENGILSATGGVPDSENNIQLGRVVTNSNTIEFIEISPVFADHTSNKLSKFNRGALGSIYATGSIVTENLLTPFEVDVTNGKYFFSEVEFNPTGGNGIQFIQYYKSGLSSWVTTATTIVNNTQYDNNGVLTGLTTSAFTKHSLYVLGDGTNENYFLVLGQNEYMTLIDAENADLPIPPTYFTDSVTPIASIYVQEGASNIIQIQDIRPVIGFRAAGVSASSVHGNLLGLDADDHTQYLLVSGARSMAGNLNMGNNNITNVGTVNGVTVESHSARHKYNGADEVGTLTPTAFAIPYASSGGKLDGWISDASTTVKGLVKLSASPTLSTNPIAVGTNDVGYLNSYTGVTYSANTLTLTSVNNTTDNVTIGLKIKSNTVAGTSFAGNPKTFTVTFTTPYPNTNYSISINGGANRTFTFESKTVNGFTINANANLAFTENVDWMTIAHGES